MACNSLIQGPHHVAQKETMVIFPFSTVELKLMGAPSIFLTFTDGASWVASWPNRLGAKANAAIKNAVMCFFISAKVFQIWCQSGFDFCKIRNRFIPLVLEC